jgi:N-glycosylase/DNA lyase
MNFPEDTRQVNRHVNRQVTDQKIKKITLKFCQKLRRAIEVQNFLESLTIEKISKKIISNNIADRIIFLW